MSTPDSGAPPEAGVSVRCPSRGNGKATNTNFTYSAPTQIALPNGTMGQSVAIGDVTGDGRNDVVVGTYDSAALFVLPQTASGQLGPAVTYDNVNVAAGGTVNQYTAAYVTTLGDLNGDGRLDVVIARFTDVAVLYQNAAGGLDPPVVLAVSDVASGVHAVAVADLNGDGRDDIVSASWMANNLDVFYQRPDGTMAPVMPFLCPHHGRRVAGDRGYRRRRRDGHRRLWPVGRVLRSLPASRRLRARDRGRSAGQPRRRRHRHRRRRCGRLRTRGLPRRDRLHDGRQLTDGQAGGCWSRSRGAASRRRRCSTATTSPATSWSRTSTATAAPTW